MSWRRATRSPYRGDQSPVIDVQLQNKVSHLQHQVSSLAHSREDLKNELRHAQTESMDVYNNTRRDYIYDVGRERRMTEIARHDADMMDCENKELKQRVDVSEDRVKRLEEQMKSTKKMYEEQLFDLKVQHANNYGGVNAANSQLDDQLREAYREKKSLELLVADLRRDLEMTGRQLVEQSEAVRFLSQEISRRDPVHLVKHQRESNALSEDLVNLQQQLATVCSERDAAFTELKRVQERLAEREGTLNHMAQQQALNNEADHAQLQLRVNQLVAQNAELQKKAAASSESEELAAQLQEKEAQTVKLTNQLKGAAQKHKKELEAERGAYEEKIGTLAQQATEAKMELKTEKEAIAKQKAKAKQEIAKLKQDMEEQREDMEEDMKALKSAQKKIQLQKTEAALQKAQPPANTASKSRSLDIAASPKPKVIGEGGMTGSSKDPGPTGVTKDVEISIVCCKNLLNRDGMMTGESDPYVIVLDPAGEKALTTATIENTLNPKFEAKTSAVKIALNTRSPGFVELQVWNYNTTFDDVLGICKIAVGDLFAKGSGTFCYPLTTRENEEDDELVTHNTALGSITLKVAIPGVAPKTDGVQQVKSDASTTDKVTFYIESCSGLLQRDGFMTGKSDPYVMVMMDPDKKKVFETTTVNDNLDPTWEVADASVSVELSKTASGFVEFQVWNSNVTKNDFLGCARLSINDIFAGGSIQRKLKLEQRAKETDDDIKGNADNLGSITINTTLAGSSAASKKDGKPKAYEVVPHAVTFHVSGCTNLWDRDGGGMMQGVSDPYVIILDKDGRKIHELPAADDTLNPKWNVQDGSKKVQLIPKQDGYMTFEVWNENVTSDDFLGCYRWKIADVFEKGPGKHVFDLGPRTKEDDEEVKAKSKGTFGKIAITTNIIVGTAVGTDPNAALRDGKKSEKYPVSFYVSSCSKLLDRDGGGMFVGVSDPYVLVLDSNKTEVLKIPEQKDTLDPKWSMEEATVKVKLAPVATDSMEFQVWNGNVGSADFMGSVVLAAPEIFAGGSGERVVALQPRMSETDAEIQKNAENLGKMSIYVTCPKVAGVAASPGKTNAKAAAGAPPKRSAAHVHIASCANLLERDGGWGSGVSDPFVVVLDAGGTEIHKTPTIDNDLNPKWSSQEGTVKLNIAPSDVIKFQVWNANVTSNDLLGYLQLTGEEILKGDRTLTSKLTVRPKENDEELQKNKDKLGTITLNIKAPNLSKSGTGTPAKPGQKPAAKSVAAKVQSTDVKIHVASCADLLDRDGGWGKGVSDPYVTVLNAAKEELLKTPEVEDTLKPTWSAPEGTVSVKVVPTDEITVQVWNANVAKDDFLGCVTLKGSELLKGTRTLTLPLKARVKENDEVINENKDKLGTITFNLTVVKPAGQEAAKGDKTDAKTKGTDDKQEPTADKKDNVPTKKDVKIHVASCEDLLDRDGGWGKGVSDPYVIVLNAAKEELLKTPEVDDALKPTWSVEEGTVSVKVGPEDEFTAQVWDANLTKADFLGRVVLKGSELLKGTRTLTLPLKPRAKENDGIINENKDKLGTITFNITGPAAPAKLPVKETKNPSVDAATADSGDSSADKKAPVDAATDQKKPAPPPKPKKVTLTVLSGSKLLERDGGGWMAGVSDPLVIITDQAGEQALETPEIKDNLDPKWTEDNTCQLLLDPNNKDTDFVRLDVWNSNAVGKDYLGGAKMKVATLMKATKPFPVKLSALDCQDEEVKKGSLGSIEIEVKPE